MSLKDTVDTDQATKNHFSFDDVVFKVDKNGRIKFGIVVSTGEDYDSDVDDSEYESDDSVSKGEVRVVWHPDGKNQVVKEQNICLADRSLTPGDIVRRSSGNTSQKGYCRDVISLADVQLKDTPFVIKNFPSERLIFDVEPDFVCSVMLDGWIGTITKVEQKLVLKTQCGAVVEVRYYDQDNVTLRDPTLKNRNGHFKRTIYYPGQTVVGSIDVLKNAKWLTSKPKVKTSQKISFLITRIEIIGISVNWEVRTEFFGSNDKDNQPNKNVTGADLNRVKFIQDTQYNAEFSETALLEVEEKDLVNLTTTSEWRMERTSFYKESNLPRKDIPSEVQEHVKIVQNIPFYSVFTFDSEEDKNGWQSNDSQMNDDWNTEDGWQTEDDDEKSEDEKDQKADKEKAKSDVDKIEEIVLSADAEQQIKDHKTDNSGTKLSFTLNTVRKSILRPSLPKNKASGAKSFQPGLNLQNQNKSISNERIKMPFTGDRYVIEVILVRNQVTVVWQDGTIESGIPSNELSIDEDFGEKEDLFPGDFVILESEKLNTKCLKYGVVQTVDQSERTAIVKWFQPTGTAQSEPELIKETSIYDLTRHPDYNLNLETRVIRIANFEGGDVKCVIGYVIGRDTEGLITVGWVDGHYSKCAPTDISPVCSQEHFNHSDESVGDLTTELHHFMDYVNSHFEDQILLAEKAISDFQKTKHRLSMNKSEMLRAFTEVHVKCRFFDNLMDTSFFTEDESEVVATARSQDSNDSGIHTKIDSEEGVIKENSTESEDQNLHSLYAKLHSILKNKLKLAMEAMNKRVSTFPSSDSHQLLGFSDLDMNEAELHNSTTIVECDERSDVMSSLTTALSTSNPEGFMVVENSPASHKFKPAEFTAFDTKKFHRAVKADHQILRTSLPSGVSVRAYEDRLDMLSVMIEGPKNTPYEDGIFLFDFQLSRDYPHSPPLCHYISYCSERLNPNLYEDGKVCVSLLGTWSGKESEKWGPGSTLLQVIVSIQGLILVAEPYFNEPGYVKEKGTPRGNENSQMYNELAVLKVIESMTNVMAKPSEVFREEIFKHFRERGDAIIGRIKGWLEQSDEQKPEFPLLPTSRGFRIKLESLLVEFRKQLEAIVQ